MAKVKSRFYWKIKDSEDRLPRRRKKQCMNRDQVFAYVSRRGEEEVIVL